jgi:ankyrin repeat protein
MYLKKDNDLNAKWHQRDRSGRFPHHILARSGGITEAFQMLLKIDTLNLDLNATDKFGETVLDLAKGQDNQDLVDLLERYNSHANTQCIFCPIFVQ